MTRRDILEAAWEVATGIALAVASALLLLWCSGCAATQRPTTPLPAQTELERAVAQAGLEAWRAAGLPITPAVRELAQLRIEEPLTAEEYDRACPAAILGRSNACLRWRDWDVPVAWVAPHVPRSRVPHAALHELCHALVYRSGLRGDYDPGHTDPRVWQAAGGENTVQGAATRALQDGGAGSPRATSDRLLRPPAAAPAPLP